MNVFRRKVDVKTTKIYNGLKRRRRRRRRKEIRNKEEERKEKERKNNVSLSGSICLNTIACTNVTY